MATYLMFGKYSSEAIKGISAERTQKAKEIIKNLGGKVNAIYALLGQHDLVLIVDFPKPEDVMKIGFFQSFLTGQIEMI